MVANADLKGVKMRFGGKGKGFVRCGLERGLMGYYFDVFHLWYRIISKPVHGMTKGCKLTCKIVTGIRFPLSSHSAVIPRFLAITPVLVEYGLHAVVVV